MGIPYTRFSCTSDNGKTKKYTMNSIPDILACESLPSRNLFGINTMRWYDAQTYRWVL